MQDEEVQTDERKQQIGRLFEQESAKLWRSLLLHTADADVASDATAEAFAQLLRRGDAVRDPKAWVWRAAFRIADGELARRRSVPHEHAGSYEMPEPAFDLARALARLPATQRRAVVLHHLSDLSVADIAVVMGTSRSVVAVHLHRGRRRLRDLLETSDD